MEHHRRAPLFLVGGDRLTRLCARTPDPGPFEPVAVVVDDTVRGAELRKRIARSCPRYFWTTEGDEARLAPGVRAKVEAALDAAARRWKMERARRS
jgi:hypothetical protein